MKKRNALIVPELDAYMAKYKEEIAHEFGIHRSVTEVDFVSSMTKQLLNKKSAATQKGKEK